MNVRLNSLRGAALPAKAACALLVTAVLAAQTVLAQNSAAPAKLAPTPQSGPTSASSATYDPQVVQAGCSSCSSGLLGGNYGSSCSSCSSCGGGSSDGCAGGCYPGRQKCDSCCCFGDGFCGRFLGGLFECLCCPDPCYEPHWNPLADSAFFADAPRPVTQMRLRVDLGWDLRDPDRAEYFWAKDRTNPQQIGPGGPCGRTGSPGKGPGCVARSVDYQDISLYTEVAAGNFGLFFEMPYRHMDPETGRISTAGCCDVSGFADLNLGTKALLLDCELAQIAFQFKTFLPTGDFTKGLGTAHVSLEPSLLFALKLTSASYLQAQVAYWIPIGGDDLYQGEVFHAHLSWNCGLWHPCDSLLLVGTLEVNEWSVMGGAYTVPDFLLNGKPVAASATTNMASAGPGARLFICNKIDVGVGTAFAFTGSHWADELVRAEFRMRF
jgi:hypothetical protein